MSDGAPNNRHPTVLEKAMSVELRPKKWHLGDWGTSFGLRESQRNGSQQTARIHVDRVGGASP